MLRVGIPRAILRAMKRAVTEWGIGLGAFSVGLSASNIVHSGPKLWNCALLAIGVPLLVASFWLRLTRRA